MDSKKTQGFTPLERQNKIGKLRKCQRHFLSLTGFTFIEIILAVAIISMLTAVSVPVISTVRQKVNEAKAQVDIQNLAVAFNDYWTVNNSYPGTLQEISQGVAPYISGKYITGMSGYQYYLLDSTKYTYTLCSRPADIGKTANVDYLLNEAAVLLAKKSSGLDWAMLGADKPNTQITQAQLQAAITKFNQKFSATPIPLDVPVMR
ncbi:MAG: prepilin-type N-terminal cleavage/methylation domain-containing protein [Candidatus Omnitrophota bacterium]